MPYLVLLALGVGLAAVVARHRGHFDTHLPPAFERAVVGRFFARRRILADCAASARRFCPTTPSPAACFSRVRAI